MAASPTPAEIREKLGAAMSRGTDELADAAERGETGLTPAQQDKARLRLAQRRQRDNGKGARR